MGFGATFFGFGFGLGVGLSPGGVAAEVAPPPLSFTALGFAVALFFLSERGFVSLDIAPGAGGRVPV